ncbi:MAG: hypothetical protein F6J87_08210 [Spirulina sp. SIO3F2]|nr:hypothetical protein [Spirulina sp. SIO3F2]
MDMWGKWAKASLKYGLAGVVSLALVLWGLDGEHFVAAQSQSTEPTNAPTAACAQAAQGNRNIRAAEQAYGQLSDFPRENTYRLADSNKVQDCNTLLYRLIYYHTRTKRRSPSLRFDWKLTLGDYLGAHETIIPDRYPTATSLDENPLERDRSILDQLNRQQRNVLVNTLVVIFEGQIPSSAPDEKPVEVTPVPEPLQPETPATPQPGDSRLLL